MTVFVRQISTTRLKTFASGALNVAGRADMRKRIELGVNRLQRKFKVDPPPRIATMTTAIAMTTVASISPRPHCGFRRLGSRQRNGPEHRSRPTV
jgi:hypothetical protein